MTILLGKILKEKYGKQSVSVTNEYVSIIQNALAEDLARNLSKSNTLDEGYFRFFFNATEKNINVIENFETICALIISDYIELEDYEYHVSVMKTEMEIDCDQYQLYIKFNPKLKIIDS